MRNQKASRRTGCTSAVANGEWNQSEKKRYRRTVSGHLDSGVSHRWVVLQCETVKGRGCPHSSPNIDANPFSRGRGTKRAGLAGAPKPFMTEPRASPRKAEQSGSEDGTSCSCLEPQLCLASLAYTYSIPDTVVGRALIGSDSTVGQSLENGQAVWDEGKAPKTRKPRVNSHPFTQCQGLLSPRV